MAALKANAELRRFSKANNHRLVTLAFETELGNTIATEGCVLVEDCKRISAMLVEVMALMEKTDPKTDKGK